MRQISGQDREGLAVEPADVAAEVGGVRLGIEDGNLLAGFTDTDLCLAMAGVHLGVVGQGT